MAEVFLSESKLISNYQSLQKALPGVDLYYACKTNSDRNILSILNKIGAKFDVATIGEIKALFETGVLLDKKRVIHTHPIKTIEEIVYILNQGVVQTFVVDNIDEIKKFEKVLELCRQTKDWVNMPNVLIRIAANNPEAKIDLSAKFGCDITEFETLYTYCKSIGLQVRGISFHAGSNCDNVNRHARMVYECIPLFRKHNLKTLDIGGGFPGTMTDGNIMDWCSPLRTALDHLRLSMIGYNDSCVEIIAEPGRYVVASAMSMVCTVIGKSLKGDVMWYYIDDGIYGMMSGVMYDNNKYDLIPHKDQYDLFRPRYKSVFSGPTCDSVDVVLRDVEYEELDIGDKLTVENVGAYSIAHASTFNSIPLPVVKVVQ